MKNMILIGISFGIMLVMLGLFGCATPKPGEQTGGTEEVACAQDLQQCPGGKWVKRVPPKCEFEKCPTDNWEKTLCYPNQRNQQCADIEAKVCAWFDEKQVKCAKYPCAEEKKNDCEACSDPKVKYYTDGPCPKG